MENKKDEYKLSSEKHDAIYNVIARQTLKDKPKDVENPRIVVLGGQPGAGKSALIKESLSERQDAVVINGDDFRRFHPKHEEIFKNHPKDAAALTDHDTREWTRKVLAEAKDGKQNIVFESTMRQATPLDQTMKAFKADGYQVEVKVMAVNEDLSRLGIRERYENQIKEQGFGRWTADQSHNETYKAMPDTLDKIERDNLADKIQVYNRAGAIVYENKQVNGEWEKQPGAKAAVLAERAVEPSEKVKKDVAERFDRVIGKMEERKSSPEELQTVQSLKSEYVAKSYQQDPAKPIKENALTEKPSVESVSVPAVPVLAKSVEDAKGKQWGGEEYAEFANKREDVVKEMKGKDAPGSVISEQESKATAAKDAIERFERVAEQDPRQNPIASKEQHEAANKAESSGRNAKDFRDFDNVEAARSRQEAFDKKPQLEALAKHPELDGAYKQLSNVQKETMGMPQEERKAIFDQTREDLSQKIGRGEIPRADVSRDESRQVIDRAANDRGLIVRDSRDVSGVYQGKVIAESSRHYLVESGTVGVRYEKSEMSREARVGENVAIQHSKDGAHKVMTPEEHKIAKTLDRNNERGQQMEMSR